MIGFFIETGHKMITYEQRKCAWNFFPIGKGFKDTPISLSMEF